jgi:putative ABC transport system permease protein
MIRNYLKIAWRNIIRNKVNSTINIAGLAIGIACVLLIMLFIKNEFSFDKFLDNSDRIYQVTINASDGDREFWAGNTPPPVGAALARNFPEIETYTRLYKAADVVLRYAPNPTAEKYFTEKGLYAVDSNFLEVFDFDLIEGSAKTCLESPTSIVITEAMAKKYFG